MSHLSAPPDDPLATFQAWYEQALREGAPAPDAMTLATADAAGRPSARTVLYKGMYGGRLGFVSNYESRKGRELAQNPRAALVFHWPSLGRQARFEGAVERAPAEISDRYFASRDVESQLGAWASQQSRPITSREELIERQDAARRRFAGGPIERPDYWGMYLFEPDYVELWISGDHRLHDRFAYRRTEGGFRPERLSP